MRSTPSPARSARAGWLRQIAATALVPLALAFLAVPVTAQTGSVRVTVTDASTMRPLAGAQVVVEGTTRGGLTDAQGTFLILNVPAGERTVRVELIGYRSASQQVNVTSGGTATIELSLTQSAIGLDEIVVTGVAGSSTKRAIGNTVAQIRAAEIVDAAPINNVQQLLNARTPGLTLMASSGQAGASSKIRIRGAGSLNAGNEPVVYVDGVRVVSGTQSGYSTGNGVVQGTNALDFINPRDIESVEVIKGPAAATLYGAEAAGGVIQIITKKGRGTSGIEWNASFEGGQTDWGLIDTPTTYWLCQDSHINNARTFPGCQLFTTATPIEQRLLVDKPLEADGRSPAVRKAISDRGLDPNQFHCLLFDPCMPEPLRTGDIWGATLSARGGGESYNFYISAERGEEQGVFYNNFSRRTSGRANFGFVPGEKLNFNVNLGYAVQDIAMPLNNNSSNSILRNSMRGRAGAGNDPNYPGYRGHSPEMSNQWDNRLKTERTTLGLTGNYNPFSWFQNRLTLGIDINNRENTRFFPIDESGTQPWGATAATGEINRFLPINRVYTIDYSGSIATNLSENYSSTFSAGMQMTKRASESSETIGEGLVANKLNLVSSAAVTRAGQGLSEQTSLGFYVQEQIGFKDRLFATAAVRVDDNSAFGRDFSLVVYPKASLSYVISEEDFFNIGFIDEMKLRGAWGQAGNAPAPFSADRTLEAAVTTIGDVSVNQLQTASYGNPNLKAETGQEIELGFDASMLRGRLGAEFTYFYQQTKDALIDVPAPRSAGFSGDQLVNIGEIRNSGMELLITAQPVVTQPVTWDATISFATNSNELVSFGGALDELRFGAFASVQRHREGYPLGGFWAVDVRRDANGAPVLTNGNVEVLNDCVWTAEQRDQCQEEYIGPMLPTREITLTNTITLFNNVRLYANADYKGGHTQWCAICSIRSRIDRNTFEVNDPRQVSDPAVAAQVATLHSLQTRSHLSDADYIKLREVSLTYTLPQQLTQRIGFNRASVTLSGRNLWMWTKYFDGYDPDVTFYSQSEFTQLDYASAPNMRRFMASVNFSF